MDNDKLDYLERVAIAVRDDDQSLVWNDDDFCNGVLALITAARRPGGDLQKMQTSPLPDREASDDVLEAMCRAHDAEESAQMGEPSLWEVHDRGDWNDHEGGWEAYRTDRIAAMRAALLALSPAQAEREGWVILYSGPQEGQSDGPR